MEGLEEINYTVIEPKNDYRSDIYSPGQTKLQLEIGQEVNPVKCKTDEVVLSVPGITEIPTHSKNIVLNISARMANTSTISTGKMIGNIRNQKAILPAGGVEKGYVYYFTSGSNGKIVAVRPGSFDIEVKGNPVFLTYEAYNTKNINFNNNTNNN